MTKPYEDGIDELFWRAIQRKNRAIGAQRIGDLNKLFARHYGGNRESYVFPDDDAGLEDLKILLHHYALNNPLAMSRIIKLRAPWMNEAAAVRLLEQIDAFPQKWRANTLGRKLRRGQQQIIVKHVTVNADQAVVTDQIVSGQAKEAALLTSG